MCHLAALPHQLNKDIAVIYCGCYMGVKSSETDITDWWDPRIQYTGLVFQVFYDAWKQVQHNSVGQNRQRERGQGDKMERGKESFTILTQLPSVKYSRDWLTPFLFFSSSSKCMMRKRNASLKSCHKTNSSFSNWHCHRTHLLK